MIDRAIIEGRSYIRCNVCRDFKRRMAFAVVNPEGQVCAVVCIECAEDQIAVKRHLVTPDNRILSAFTLKLQESGDADVAALPMLESDGTLH